MTDIAVTRDDRLTRFGLSYIRELFSQNGVTIHCLAEKKTQTVEEELMEDFMSILASFTGRFSQMKSKEAKKKLLQRAQDKLDNEN